MFIHLLFRVIISLLGIILMVGTLYDILFMRMKVFARSDPVCERQEELPFRSDDTATLELHEKSSDINGLSVEVNGTASALHDACDKKDNSEENDGVAKEVLKQERGGNLKINDKVR